MYNFKFLNRASIGLLPILLSACISEQVEPQIDCTTSPLEVEAQQVSNTTCDATDGAFSIVVAGGEPPYLYAVSNETNETGTFSGLNAGVYSVIVSDAKGCETNLSVTIENTEGVNLDQINTSETGCGTSNGSIEVIASGGAQPYLFSLSGGTPQSGNTFSNLFGGTYTISVEDAAGCETSQQVEILSGVDYQSAIAPIIQTNCAISGCHSGSVAPSLTTFENIQASASRVKARTQNRSMPRGRSLTQTQIDLIACWVDDGAPASSN